jgi:Domain of unknown function (DUF4041)/Protein of unknown function (DUF2510)/Meiotically up-regulated gene 113
MSKLPRADWYPDPEYPGQLRYWDGRQWTEHRAPMQQPAPSSATPPSVEPQATHQTAQPGVASGQGQSAARTAEPRTAKSASKVPLFGARKHAQETSEELERLRGEMQRLGVLDVAELRREREELHAEIAQQRASFEQERFALDAQLTDLRNTVVLTQEAEILQEIGIYEYRHPLSDSIAYKAELTRLQGQIKTLAKQEGGAIRGATQWQVNGSAAQGHKMVKDFSKLMLRAYNAEADNMVRGMKPYKLDSAVDRLNKVVNTIQNLGKTMSIQVTPEYHRLRIRELELAADYQEMLAREKEKEREERERLREQRKVEQEIAREKERLEKERQHYANAIQALLDKGDTEGAERMRAQLIDVEKAIADVDYRAANARAGYVYVISNLGAFGEQMIKVGMTRRLEPRDRIRELSDASVPFNFDVHALFFADDAVGIEAEMHRRLADKRVNRVNLRREFFYATPAEARDLLAELAGELLEFEEFPEAVEFHQSQNTRTTPNPSSNDRAAVETMV